MSIAFYSSDDNPVAALRALQKALPDHEVLDWQQVTKPADVEYAVLWGVPDNFFNRLTAIRAIFSWGAGVDHLLNNSNLPDVPVYRLIDAGMADKIADYVLYGVMGRHRNFNAYARQQTKALWQPLAESSNADYRVGIMGMGVIGSRIATRLTTSGYSVAGWKRTPTESPSIQIYHGHRQLEAFLEQLDTLVCVLPMTEQTRHLVDHRVFDSLPVAAQFINVGRGDHVVESDLLAALDSGHLSHALLDVCAAEPLPAEHQLWHHPRVTITPHIAGPTQEQLSAQQVAEGVQRLSIGGVPEGLVDRSRGY